MTDFIKFPKIKQFRDVIKHVKTQADFKGLDDEGNAIFEHTSAYPVLKFVGTVKMHGTNAAVVMDKDRNIQVQSRSRHITVESDNAGFAAFVEGINSFSGTLAFPTNCVVFGEFCGGNIQKGVALNGIDKMFVVFAAKNLETDKWFNITEYDMFADNLTLLNEHNIYHIGQFPTYEIEIDFNKPELAQEKLAKITEAIETECPVGKHFGVSGIGEGAVWSNKDDTSSEFKFKVKGSAHSVSKVKTLAAVDIEHINTVREFVEMTVTTQRLEQGIEVMKERGLPIERKTTGDFLRWLVGDILSEELDLLTGNGLCAKDVGGQISNAARPYWFSRTDEI